MGDRSPTGPDSVALDNLCTGSRDNVARVHGRAGFELVACDVTEPLPAAARRILAAGQSRTSCR